jgi:hypothetical protein
MMTRAQIQAPAPRHIHAQATRVLPGHGTGVLGNAFNDARYWSFIAAVRRVLSLLANVIGGGLVILGMFLLPQLLASLL